MGYKLKDIFFASIPEYTVSTKKELKELISDLTSLLSQSKFFRKLWFRGQRKEYTITRSKETLRKLGLPLSFEIMPALVPSLGRDIEHKNFDEICNLNGNRATCYMIMQQKILMFRFAVLKMLGPVHIRASTMRAK